MTLAERLEDKHNTYHCADCNPHPELRNMFIAAINEAISITSEEVREEAAKVAENYRDKVCGDNIAGRHAKSASGFIATRIRALK